MHPTTISLHQLFHGPVEARQHLAKELYQKYGAAMLLDENLCEDIEQLKEFALLLSRHMAELGMGEQCSRCAAGIGGGCCSLYMAGETDSIQMLMNMLAGVTVRQVRSDGVECCYLEDRGCLFTVKPIFCLNYNCKTILASISPENSRELERFSGKLLGKQYEVEQKLLKFIKTMKNM
ncbi:MAG: hypothetical protein SCH71_15225 [Desulfobulbaceae bacterium]|nr:hypothetical protein [Desulfobulbaceae bacterium]